MLADGAVSGVLPDNCRVRTFRAGYRRCAACAWRPLSRASWACGEESSSRTCARSTPSSPLRSCARCAFRLSSGSPTGARATCSRPRSVSRRRSRASTIGRFRCPRESSARSGTESTLTSSRARRRAPVPGRVSSRSVATPRRRVSDVAVAAVPLAEDDVELHVYGPALSDDERIHRGEPSRSPSFASLGLEERGQDRRLGAALGDPRASRGTRRAREQHAPALRQGRLRGRGCVPPGSRLQPDSTSPSPPSSASPAGIRARSPIESARSRR